MDLTSQTDSTLITAACGGDEGAFSELCRRYLSWAHRVAFGILAHLPGGATLAEDAAQNTLIRFVQPFPGFPAGQCLKQTVFKLAVSEARKLRRQARRRREISGLPNVAAALEPLQDTSLADQVRVAVDSLPEHQREAVVLRYWLPASLEEVAAGLEIPVGTVKSRLHSAVETLRKNPHLRSLWDE